MKILKINRSFQSSNVPLSELSSFVKIKKRDCFLLGVERSASFVFNRDNRISKS